MAREICKTCPYATVFFAHYSKDNNPIPLVDYACTFCGGEHCYYEEE